MREKLMQIMEEVNPELVVDLDQDLIATGILDSFDIVSIVTEVEEVFNVEIDPDVIIPSNFQTANIILDTMIKILN